MSCQSYTLKRWQNLSRSGIYVRRFEWRIKFVGHKCPAYKHSVSSAIGWRAAAVSFAAGLPQFQAASNHQRQPEKTKPLGIEPNGFLLDGLIFQAASTRARLLGQPETFPAPLRLAGKPCAGKE